MTTYSYVQGSDRYDVNEHGHIGRLWRNQPHSAQWVVRGAVRFNNFGHQVEFVPFPRCFTEPREWQYKNGKGRWLIADLDHGTRRVQMCPVQCSHVLEVQS